MHLQTLPGQDRIERAVHMGSHLQVLTLDELTQHLQDFWDLLTLGLTLCSKGKVH
jgi:hypothetical protein